jgi:apolipoprotein N-acyltransferase
MAFVGMNSASFFEKTLTLWSLGAARCRGASLRVRLSLSFVFGSFMALAMPPFGIFVLPWISLPVLMFLLQGARSSWQSFLTGWIFAFGFFIFGLYWIAAAMFVDLAHFWWAVPLAVAGLPAFFAIYYGFGALVAYRIGLDGIAGALMFGLLWFLGDYARGHMFTGFPWNLLGYSWSRALSVLQFTSVGGIYGLSLLTSVAAVLPAALVSRTRISGLVFLGSLVLFVVLSVVGEYRILTTSVGVVPFVRLRLVQPDIAQAEKWVESERERYFQDILNLTAQPAQKPITHFIWPETASTYYITEDVEHRAEISDRIPASSLVLTGVIRHDFDADNFMHFYNSLVAVDGLGHIVAGYDKSHLVPFGEFMPLRRYLPLRTIAGSGVDFTAGTGVRSLRVHGLPLFSPLICYEAIFPGQVVDPDDRPQFLLNITNDGWYGMTTGPYQHFAIVRVRAIEEGLPLVRAANTGISGIVDPLGRVTARLGLGKKGILDGDLPTSLPRTFFARWRERPLWIMVAMLLVTFCCIKAANRGK